MLKNIIIAIVLILSACNQELQPPTIPSMDAGAEIRPTNPNIDYNLPTCDIGTQPVTTCNHNAVCQNSDTYEPRINCVLKLTSDTTLWFNCVESCN